MFSLVLGHLRFALRSMRRQPWTVMAIVLSIALGVGANTAVTGVLQAVLLNPLGIAHPDRVASVTVHLHKLQMEDAETSAAELRDLQGLSKLFAHVTATEPRAWTLRGSEPSRFVGVAVTPPFFDVFAQPLALGRGLRPSDHYAVVISDGLWRRAFGADPAVLRRSLSLDGQSYEVVGVARASFRFPVTAEAWVPLLLPPDRFRRGNDMVLSLYAQLRDGVSLRQAQASVDIAVQNLLRSPEGKQLRQYDYGIDVRPLGWRVAGTLRRPLFLLWAVALLLFLAACANVAGLLLASAFSRGREIATRVAVGAARWQIVEQLMSENVLLACGGAALGIAFASGALQLLRFLPLPQQALLATVQLDRRTLFYGLALAIGSSFLFGMTPALQAVRQTQAFTLTRWRRRAGAQNVFLGAQVAIATLLLIVTGLLLMSLQAAQGIDPGFESKNVTTAYLIKPKGDLNSFYGRLLLNLESEPGVQSAALAYSVPFGGGAPTSLFNITGRQQAGQPQWHAQAYQVTDGYFQTLRIPLLRGRLFTKSDREDSAPVCLIDNRLAQRFFSGDDPIGQQIAMYGGPARIVGVVGSIVDAAPDEPWRPNVYYSLRQITYFPEVGIVVRSRSAVSAAPLIRRAVHQADPHVAVYNAMTMRERIAAANGTRRTVTELISVLGCLCVFLAAIGLYGVLGRSVSERTGEIGIRMALGAQRKHILVSSLQGGLQPALWGLSIGVIAASVGQRFLQGFLYGVLSFEPAVLVGGVLLMCLVLGAAAFVPASRAAAIDPQSALRSE